MPWTDLNEISNNEYSYNYKIPFNGSLGQYQVIYVGQIEDKDAHAMETFHVINKSENFINAIKLYGYISDIRTNAELLDCSVKIIDMNTNEVVSQSLSNEQGYWEGYVYPGEYVFRFSKNGFIDLEINAQIGDEHNEMQFNNIGLESEIYKKKGNGIFTVEDKYTLKNGQPLVGLQIKISNIVNPKEVTAEDVTNDSGEWQCFLDSGDYLVKINGRCFGKDFDKTLRLKVNNQGEYNFDDLSKNTAMIAEQNYISPGEGAIEVKNEIKDRYGNPIIDVQVNALRPNNMNDIIAQTYTNINGQWILNLDPGNYIIEYYHPKFKTITEKITVK